MPEKHTVPDPKIVYSETTVSETRIVMEPRTVTVQVPAATPCLCLIAIRFLFELILATWSNILADTVLMTRPIALHLSDWQLLLMVCALTDTQDYHGAVHLRGKFRAALLND